MLGYYLKGIRSVVAATRQAGVKRLLVVGGAGRLEVAPGLQLLDTPQFPAAYKATAEGARQALQLLREERELDWTMLSPSALLVPGERTGKFEQGSVLAGYNCWESTREPLTDDDDSHVEHNPSPSML